jgi:hypothetical protein
MQSQSFFKNFVSTLYRLFSGKFHDQDKKFSFYYFSWVAFLFFLTGFGLVNQNPFVLFSPFSLYRIPVSDTRRPVPIFLSDSDGTLYKTTRKMLFDASLRKNILTLVGEIAKSPFFEMERNAELVHIRKNLKQLLNLQSAVISIWTLENDTTVIIDLREATLNREIELIKIQAETAISYTSIYEEAKANIDKEKIKTEARAQRMQTLEYTFKVLEKTIFENFPNVKSIGFKLDGHSKNIASMNYNLSEPKTRVSGE